MQNHSAPWQDLHFLTVVYHGDRNCLHRRRRLYGRSQEEISALPEAVLIHVASFLHQIPLALFCVAMTAESSAWRKADWNLPLSLASQKILSSREGMWDILDFSQHDHTLRWNLTDDDLGALLRLLTVGTNSKSCS